MQSKPVEWLLPALYFWNSYKIEWQLARFLARHKANWRSHESLKMLSILLLEFRVQELAQTKKNN